MLQFVTYFRENIQLFVVIYEIIVFKNLCVCVFCSEESLYSVQCVLMVYNDLSKQWITCGNHTHSRVYVLHSAATESYRFVGVSEQDREACISNAFSYI